MARRNIGEVLIGALVLLLALGFLGYAVANSGRSAVSGYTLTARFDHIDGLVVGADARIAGVKVGRVTATEVDPKTFLAVVTLGVADDIKLPRDSSAAVTSDGLLGGKFVNIEPGGAAEDLPAGGTITITQGSVSLEQLLGKFIFSATNLKSGDKDAGKDGGKDTGRDAGQPGDKTPATP